MTDDPDVLRATTRVEDESVEYVEEKDVIRYPSVCHGDEPLEYDTMPVERWIEYRAAEAALDAVREELETRVDGNFVGIATGIGSADEETTKAARSVVVYYVENFSNSPISFDRLEELTPKRVETTIIFRGETYSRSIPVEFDSMELLET